MLSFRPLLTVLLFGLISSTFSSTATAQLFLGAQQVGPGDAAPEVITSASSAGGADILSSWSPTPPTLDGTISVGEWSNATILDIGFGTNPVTAYLMNDAGFLYLAIDNEDDTVPDPNDSGVLAFDDEGGTPPLLGDGVWNTATCPVTEEGAYGIGNFDFLGFPSGNVFQGISAAGFCAVEASAGSEGAYSAALGHLVYEMRIDLAASHLQAQPGETFGAWIGSLNGIGVFSGGTSPDPFDPSTYVGLTLASAPVPVSQTTWGRIKTTHR